MTDRTLLEDVRDALGANYSWLDRWAKHAGNCRGDERCTCGLVLARSECATTLARVEAALVETEEEKVERVARALCKTQFYDIEPDMYESEEAFFTKDGPDAWKHFGDSDFMHQARAAIAAMGE